MTTLLIKNGLLIDGTGKEPKKNATILVKDGKIEAIFTNNNNSTLNESEFDKVIDLAGLTILPGFINTHVHAGFKYLKGEPMRDFHEEYLKACISEGVTTIRDEGMFTNDTIDTVVEKKRLRESSPYYPTIITTGKFFSAPKGYGGQEPLAISSVEEAKNKVCEVLDKGINMIKTVLEDGFDPSTIGLPKLSDEILMAICDEAHRRGVKVSAHVTQSHNLQRLMDAGIDDASHMVYDDLNDELIKEMVAKDIYVVPTLTLLKSISDKFGAPLINKGKDNVKRFVELGGKIALGDDFINEEAPWYRLGMPMMELKLLKEAGLSNMQIIIAATKHGAEICSIDKDVGTIEVGKKADLLIIEGNPLEDLESIANVRYVLKDGIIVK